MKLQHVWICLFAQVILFIQIVEALAALHIYTGSSDPLLFAYVIRTLSAWNGSYMKVELFKLVVIANENSCL